MKKFLITIIILISTIILIFKVYDMNYFKYKPWHEGDTSKWQMVIGDNKAYELALDYQELPIFKNPDLALKQLNKDYKLAIKALKKQHKITFNVNKYNYKAYYNLGWQLNTNDKELAEQARMITYILGFYENSIKTY